MVANGGEILLGTRSGGRTKNIYVKQTDDDSSGAVIGRNLQGLKILRDCRGKVSGEFLARLMVAIRRRR